MKRVSVMGAVIALVFFGAPSPANAAQKCQTGALGLVCLNVVDGNAVVTDALGNTLVSAPVPPVVETVTKTVTVNVPGPTVTVPGPTQTITVPAPRPSGAPAPATVTRTAPAATVTATETVTQEGATLTQAPTTVTETATTTRQSGGAPATLSNKTTTPMLAEPPSEPPARIDLLPDTPVVAAATGSIFGLIVGLLAAFILMFIAYRRGQVAGEEATLREFLGYLRGEPQPGRHRATN